MRAKSSKDSSGFTILELTIVLVVIALVVGGVVVGRSVIRNAELQSIITDVNKYKNAAKLFRDKYKYLPGDFPRAAEFWGSYSACPSPAPSVERVKQTCDGDGDGFIASSMSTPMAIDVMTVAQFELAPKPA